MPFSEAEIPCNFVGSFKVGDNLVFNARILTDLVSSNNDGTFNKLIVVQVGSLLEAALGQVIFRAQHFNREGVPNISAQDRKEIEGKKVDKLNSIIDVLKKYKVLNALGAEIYSDLHKLRKYRNKVHIQDAINIPGVSRDDGEAFSDAVCRWAVDLNFRVLSYLSDALRRPAHLENYVNALSVPVWNEGRG